MVDDEGDVPVVEEVLGEVGGLDEFEDFWDRLTSRL